MQIPAVRQTYIATYGYLLTILFMFYLYCFFKFPFSALTLLIGWQEGHLACKKNWMLVCWWWRLHWSFARLIAPVVTTTSIILSSNKIQKGDVLVPANPDPSGNGRLNGERESSAFKL